MDNFLIPINAHQIRLVREWFKMYHFANLKFSLILSGLVFGLVMAHCTNAVLCSSQVTTVDRYQGQQNDYIILSLVRTKTVGHLRDVRRLVVAMSRARLGLYILARVSLFHSCSELQPAFNLVCVAAFVVVGQLSKWMWTRRIKA